MNYVEVRVNAAVDSGELVAMFTGTAPAGAWESPGAVHLCWAEDAWDPAHLVELHGILERLGIGDPTGLITTCTVKDQDWNQSWSRSLTPIRVGKSIVIRQSWNSAEGPAARVELVIDPKRAFGSGYHATTQLLLEWLEEEIRGGERVLDVGTGSGILAMAALRLGAGSALGIDNDPVAIECAREYAKANGFGAELDLRVGNISGMNSYDIITANIDARTLLRLSPPLARLLSPRGRLLLSGLQAEDHDDIADALRGFAMIVARRDREEWIALMVERR